MSDFGQRLRTAMDERGQLCVGIDPHPALLADWGLPDSPSGLRDFGERCVAALGADVAAFKPQSAFFERHGSAGVGALERLLAAIRECGALALLDVKRGDIGSTMQAYADAYLTATSPLFADAVTLSPYLGFESLRPALAAAAANEAGVFVLALTSNPEGGAVQLATTPAGSVAGQVLAAVKGENSRPGGAGSGGLGSVGVVIGASVDVAGRSGSDVDLDVGGPVLAPGFGAQGGTAADLRRTFAGVLDAVLPSTSRAVLAAGPDPAALAAAARQAAAWRTG